VIVAISARRRPLADPMDTVIYGAGAARLCGYENLAYLVQHPEMWRSLAVLRSVLTVPSTARLASSPAPISRSRDPALRLARTGITRLGAHLKSCSDGAGADRAARGFRFSVADAAEKPGHRPLEAG